MITTKQAKGMAIDKYIELWGEDFVQEKKMAIGASWGMRGKHIFEYRIDQDDSYFETPTWDAPLTIGGTKFSDHSTLFVFDLEKETMTVEEHY